MTEESNNNYVVYVHTTPTGRQYFGMTCNIKERWRQSHYKNTSLEPYIEQFGWKNLEHKVVRENLTRDEALMIEDELIRKARENGTCINMIRSGHYTRTDEFREERNAYQKDYGKVWRKENPEKCKKYKKTYRESHREQHNAKSLAYYEANKDKINERRREKRKRNKGKK